MIDRLDRNKPRTTDPLRNEQREIGRPDERSGVNAEAPLGPKPPIDPSELDEKAIATRRLSPRLEGLDATIVDAALKLSHAALTPEELGELHAKLDGLSRGTLLRVLQGTRPLFGKLAGTVDAKSLTAGAIYDLFALRSHEIEAKSRIEGMPPAHQPATVRFLAIIDGCMDEGLLTPGQARIVREHVIRLAERGRNPPNTGNLSDLFVYTLHETRDPVRAFAQVLADSVKVIPMPRDAVLEPAVRKTADGTVYRSVGELPVGEPEKMLIAHTAVAYTDAEMRSAALEMIQAHKGRLSTQALDRELYEMILQSQHLPSSAFVLSKASGFALEVREIAEKAGYSAKQASAIQSFFDVSSEFQPEWFQHFVKAGTPARDYIRWRERYHAAREHLPETLRHQLAADTLTNFLEGTMTSGKWVDAAVTFEGAKDVAEVQAAIAKIVRQYHNEWQELHRGDPGEFIRSVGSTLAGFGIVFEEKVGGVAMVDERSIPANLALLEEQVRSAIARKEAKSRS